MGRNKEWNQGRMAMRSNGYTLLELMITIAIVGILVAVGIPSFRVFSANAERREASSSLYSAFQRARSEALARNTDVAVCPQATSSADPSCASSGGSYLNGWVVHPVSVAAPTGDNIYQAHGPLNAAVLDVTGTPATQLSFGANGRASATLHVTLKVKTPAAAGDVGNDRCLTVELSGRISLREITSATPCA